MLNKNKSGCKKEEKGQEKTLGFVLPLKMGIPRKAMEKMYGPRKLVGVRGEHPPKNRSVASWYRG